MSSSVLSGERLTIDEAARLAGVHRMTIDRWCKGHVWGGRKLRRYKLGGRVLILREDLERFVAETVNE